MIIKIIVWSLAGLGIMNIILFAVTSLSSAIMSLKEGITIIKMPSVSYVDSFRMLVWFLPLIIYLCLK